MSKDKFKKIPISKFISDKKLDKIANIIEKSDDVSLNYDRIEELLKKDYVVKDLGTNRLVLLHKDKKYKDLIFKVSGDSHGVEANYREFYNGDLDKRLTFSYSISENGMFIVQERVKRMTNEIMKKRKKDVREMLKCLSKKLLLVDCRLSNFKNFGVRKNGDVCLLDHGDTIPLPKYQGNEIVNISEESCVSLRCKKMVSAIAKNGDIEPCGGKLKYSDDYDYFICERCGQTSSINDAYREFYGDKRIKLKGSKTNLKYEANFDPDEWKEHIKKYCIQKMNDVEKEEKGEMNELARRMIDGVLCENKIKGYFIPNPTPIQTLKFKSMKLGTISPEEYLKAIGLNPKHYKVDYNTSIENKEENINDNKEENNNMKQFKKTFTSEQVKEVAEFVTAKGLASDTKDTIVTFDEISEALNVDMTDTYFIGSVRKAISTDKEKCGGCIFKLDERYFSFRRVRTNNGPDNFNKRQYQPKREQKESTFNKETSVEKESDSRTYKNYNPRGKFNNDVVKKEEKLDSYFDNNPKADYVQAYAEKHKTTIVEDEEVKPSSSIIELSEQDIKSALTNIDNAEYVLIKKYYVPVEILDDFYNSETGMYEIPSKIKKVLKNAGYNPKKYLAKDTSALYDTVTEKESEAIADEDSYDEDIHTPEETVDVKEAIVKDINEAIDDKIFNDDYDHKFGIVYIDADIVMHILSKYMSDFKHMENIRIDSEKQLEQLADTVKDMMDLGEIGYVLDFGAMKLGILREELIETSNEEEDNTSLIAKDIKELMFNEVEKDEPIIKNDDILYLNASDVAKILVKHYEDSKITYCDYNEETGYNTNNINNGQLDNIVDNVTALFALDDSEYDINYETKQVGLTLDIIRYEESTVEVPVGYDEDWQDHVPEDFELPYSLDDEERESKVVLVKHDENDKVDIDELRDRVAEDKAIVSGYINAQEAINSYYDENKEIETKNEEDDELNTEKVLEAITSLTDLIIGANRRMETSNQELINLIREFVNPPKNVTIESIEPLCDNYKDPDALSYVTSKIDKSTLYVMELDSLKDKKFVIKNGDKVIGVDLHNLLCDVFPNMIEDAANVKNVNVDLLD